jgi:hypothetical protein
MTLRAEFQVHGNSVDDVYREAEVMARDFFGDHRYVIESIDCAVHAQTYGGLVVDWIADVVAEEVE